MKFTQEKMSTRPSTPPSYARLALIDRVPEELWMEVHDTVQDTVIKTTAKKRKAKWLSEEALQIAVKRDARRVQTNLVCTRTQRPHRD